MAQSTKATSTNKRRTQIKDLPKKDKKLSTEDMKKVKGGVASASDAKKTDSEFRCGTGTDSEFKCGTGMTGG